MGEHETFEYLCWRQGQSPSRVTAQGPESAARDYAARLFAGTLYEQAPIGKPMAQSMDVIAVCIDGSHLYRFEVRLN